MFVSHNDNTALTSVTHAGRGCRRGYGLRCWEVWQAIASMTVSLSIRALK